MFCGAAGASYICRLICPKQKPMNDVNVAVNKID